MANLGKKMTDKLYSRKLLAFFVATAALWLGVIDQGTWQGVAITYLGAQGLVDLTNSGIGFLKNRAEGTVLAASPQKDED